MTTRTASPGERAPGYPREPGRFAPTYAPSHETLRGDGPKAASPRSVDAGGRRQTPPAPSPCPSATEAESPPASRSFQLRIALKPRKKLPWVCHRQNGRMANITT